MRRHFRRARSSGIAALAALGTLLAVLPGPATAAGHARADRLQRDADALRDAGVTGVAVRLRTPDGVREVTSGTGDLATGRPVPRGGFLRIGSTTKSFVATVLLQLVGEGRLRLDDTVERWLPGTVTGNGNDGRTVTVRQLLGHTSGLPEYAADVVPRDRREYEAERDHFYSPERLVALAMKHRPAFRPGTRHGYSNTNYVLAGMIVRAVTGHTWQDEVAQRILRPLHLKDTRAPEGRPRFPHPHATEYQQFTPGGPYADTTAPYLPYDSGADGAMISKAADLDAFFAALNSGSLLEPAEQAEMRRTVAVPDAPDQVPGTRAGLGLFNVPLSCGGTYWGHAGSGIGYVVQPAATPDGRRSVTVSLHSRPADQDTAVRQLRAMNTLIDHALCGISR
ncbi:serine hydrolase [Streptomyces sp. WAC 06725]|uniref:serine hydrolase domain-containing protein n=1 Tax=Streptomyces sp. WAC 06725 TaxID=2203209 RepID=UPI000F73AC35|nr:serine hydrolase domain-containing protein [Streptomyces sp. WAC 06725]RSO20060.1 serine hydrolase [Streptomyces sp. WAC 06725]